MGVEGKRLLVLGAGRGQIGLYKAAKEISDIEKESFKCNSVGELKYFGNMKGYYGRGPWTRLIKREIAENTLFNTELKMGEDIVWNIKQICELYKRKGK